jgi:hypothetical protein
LLRALQADGEYEVRVYGLKHQKEKRSMDYFAGLDASLLPIEQVVDPHSQRLDVPAHETRTESLRTPVSVSGKRDFAGGDKSAGKAA